MIEASAWARSLRGIEPAAKLLAIYVADLHGMSRFIEIDVDQAAAFCGGHISAEAIFDLAVKIPVPSRSNRIVRKICFDLYNVIPGCVEK